MTQEEKAKAYDEAIKRAKEINNEQKTQPFDVMLKVFPELKESEDERIRKELIDFVRSRLAGFPQCEKFIAWLEKQGEHSAKNIVEAWKDMRLEVYQQASGNRHEPNYSDDNTKIFSLNDIDEIIEKISEQKPTEKYNITGIGSKNAQGKLGEMIKKLKPVNEVLEKKFKVGDFITDGILIGKIDEISEHGYHAYFRDHYADVPDIENWHKWTIQDAKDGDVLSYVTDEGDLWIMIYWSLYEPYEGHIHYHALLVNDNFTNKGTCCICIDDLKPATKEQRDLLFQKMKEAGYELDAEKKELKKIEQNPAWSKEDEKMFNSFLHKLEVCDLLSIKEIIWIKDKLKSLRPQNTWEPSDEQMKCLDNVKGSDDHNGYVLNTLYNDLKKLKE